MKKGTKKSTEIRSAARKLLDQIAASPTAYHVCANIRRELLANGYRELPESEPWELKAPGGYFVERNDSSLIAFFPGSRPSAGYRVFACHSDSPALKLKEAPELEQGGYIRLNVEKYGGLLCAPWFDRPLSLAGRVIADDGAAISTRLVNIDRDLLMIPSLAIHFNREANDGYKYSIQKDLLPVFGDAADKGQLSSLISRAAGVRAEEILSQDLYLYARDRGTFWGAGEQYLSSPRLDDQECVWCGLAGLLTSDPGECTRVLCVFDNEEVGSGTRQGAAGTFFADVLERIEEASGRSAEERQIAIANSIMISADNAHAIHPAHIDKADPVNRPHMNGGIVLKFSANQKYTTDGISAAIVRKICRDHDIPLQIFHNHSDLAGGSTLGNISGTQVSMTTADIGLAQLAMHSPYESAGAEDVTHLIRFARAFFDVIS